MVGPLVRFRVSAIYYFVIHSSSGQSQGLVYTRYKCFNGHTRLLSMNKWLLKFGFKFGSEQRALKNF